MLTFIPLSFQILGPIVGFAMWKYCEKCYEEDCNDVNALMKDLIADTWYFERNYFPEWRIEQTLLKMDKLKNWKRIFSFLRESGYFTWNMDIYSLTQKGEEAAIDYGHF